MTSIMRGRLLGAATIVGCAALLTLSGCTGAAGHAAEGHDPASASPASAGTHTGPAPFEVIPFKAIPATSSGDSGSTATDAAAPECAASDLRVTGTTGGGAGGEWHIPLTVTDTSSAACGFTVADASIGYIAPGHSTLTTLVKTIDPWATFAGTMRLKPGASLKILTSTPDCAGSSSAVTPVSQFDLLFHGKAIAEHGGRPPMQSFSCGPVTAAVQEPQPPAAAAGSLASLQVAVDAPATATAGGTLDYTVTLSDPDDKPVSLAACPAYTEKVTLGSRTVQKSYLLNCGDLSAIPADSGEDFSMRIPVPTASGSTATTGELSWTLSSGNGAGASLKIHG